MGKTIYILIGPQGSGKTRWAQNILMSHDQTGVVRISQDDQGKAGPRQLFHKCLDDGVSVVIDRMNFNFEQRHMYTQYANLLDYDIVFVWFNVSKDTCLRRLATRQGHPTVSPDSDHSGMLDFYFSNFEEPSSGEYDEILTTRESGLCKTLDLRNRCYRHRVIIVGDIHGCYDEFINLLDQCKYREGDIVVATGDLVDRGPEIKETLIWFRNTPGTYTVEGNHDNKVGRYWAGNPVKIANGLDRTIEQCGDLEPTRWSAWLKSLPQIIRLNDFQGKPFYVVHAGVDGMKPMYVQRMETCLYARNLGGKDFFDDKDGIPWWEILTGGYTIASGHIISDNSHPCQHAYCLDGGAFQGGQLRALILDNDSCQIKGVSGYDGWVPMVQSMDV